MCVVIPCTASKINNLSISNEKICPSICVVVNADRTSRGVLGFYSKKFAHGAVKYEIAIDVCRSQVVWINRPFCGGLHDKTIYVEHGLRNKILDGKKII